MSFVETFTAVIFQKNVLWHFFFFVNSRMYDLSSANYDLLGFLSVTTKTVSSQLLYPIWQLPF